MLSSLVYVSPKLLVNFTIVMNNRKALNLFGISLKILNDYWKFFRKKSWINNF